MMHAWKDTMMMMVVHVYQEENEGHQSFTISDRAGLIELATRDVELMEEEPDHSKKRLQKSKCVTEKQERREQFNAHVTE
jgi:hypothetical protein